MVVLATLLGALLTAAAPVSSEPTFTRGELRGFFTRDSLCFDSPVDLDWEAIARREFKEFPVDNPPRNELLKHTTEAGGDTSFFTFSAALPDTLNGLHFYLITETGVRPIGPKRLFGIIQYPSFTPDKFDPPVFSGTICLPVPDGLDDAGFVATSKAPLSWQKEPATLVRSGSTTRVRLQSGFATLPPPGITETPIEVKTAYILSSPELTTKYLLVRRVVDPTNCEFTYDIYYWKKGLPVIASNPYGCDV
jgi:hypothetical protein